MSTGGYRILFFRSARRGRYILKLSSSVLSVRGFYDNVVKTLYFFNKITFM